MHEVSAEDARNERQDKDGEEQQFSGRSHLSGLNSDLKQNISNFQSLTVLCGFLIDSFYHSQIWWRINELKSLQFDCR